MMKSYKITLVLVLCSFWCLDSKAQNINQSVQVSNDYQARFADFPKNESFLSIPDSLYKFNYSFDYSVFDSPYKGSYDFEPYEILMTPQKRQFAGNKFHLRAGVGYSLHPELDLAWNPVQKDSIGLSIINSGRGRLGLFRESREFTEYKGYDLYDNFSILGRFGLKKSDILIGAGYDGIFATSPLTPSFYNTGYAKLAIRSSFANISDFDLSLDYRLGSDALTDIGSATKLSDFKLYGSLKASSLAKYTIGIDYFFETQKLSDYRIGIGSHNFNFIALTPKIVLSFGVFDINAGAQVDFSLSSPRAQLRISPIANASVDIEPLSLRLFAGIKGGRRPNSYHTLKNLNHFYSLDPLNIDAANDFLYERINLFAGIRGSIGSYFQYELSGGYKVEDRAPLDAQPSVNFTSLSFANMSSVYLNLDAHWLSERFNLDAALKYNRLDKIECSAPVFAPASFTAYLAANYNWLKRIYLGLSLDASSSRKVADSAYAYSDILPWCDLALTGEYKLNENLSLWLKAANLLGMSIERQAGFIEKGPYFTIGLSLNF